MEEKERYELKVYSNSFDDSEVYDYAIIDNKNEYCLNTFQDYVDLLNQQDNEIKLWKIKAEHTLKCYQEQSAKDLKTIYDYAEENQQLKEQLSNEEQSHDLCIISFEEKIEKLRKQIKFESDARKRFKRENQQLKQSQRMLAVDELIKLRRQFFDLLLFSSFCILSPIIDEQIKKLMEN